MNSKDKKIKLYKELNRRLKKNQRAQYDLGYLPYDKPIHKGYDIYYKLRDDIKRRDDYYVFEYILRKFGKSSWCKNTEFRRWDYLTKSYVNINPYIRHISEKEYDELLSEAKKWFTKYDGQNKIVIWGKVYDYYINTIPEFFFKKKIKKHYKTHYKVIDSALLQEEAYLIDRLKWEFYGKLYGRSSAPKWYCKVFHKKEKNKCNMAIRKALKSRNIEDFENIPVDPRHRNSATWYYW